MGGYNAFGKEGWNDEVLMGDKSGEREVIVRKLIEEEGSVAKDKNVLGQEKEKGTMDLSGLTRRTEADERGDVRSLERALTRTLYLLVKRKKVQGKEGAFWSFPNGVVEGKEGLKEVSLRYHRFQAPAADYPFPRQHSESSIHPAAQTCSPGSLETTL